MVVLFLSFILLTAVGAMAGCGSTRYAANQIADTPRGNYSFSVTGATTDGTTSQTLNMQMTVQ
jgi:hypothetical protein